jgi:D-aminoacyl-tRNA deacylase
MYDLVDWEQETPDLYTCPHRKIVAYFIDDIHLNHDHVDRELASQGILLDAVVFASRHASRSGHNTLSVHPVGNYRSAAYGGRERTLVPAAPYLMAQALRHMAADAQGLPYLVCYEVTHHGPYLETPSLFIEVGSTAREWQDRQACRVVAAAITRLEVPSQDTVAVGIGGGHYAPRFTDIAKRKRVAFGHMIPRYHLEDLNLGQIRQVIAATPGAQCVFAHGDMAESLLPQFVEAGLTVQ